MPDPPNPDRPRPQVGGWRVPGTTVHLPRSGKAGTVVTGQAPAGSTVSYGKRESVVGPDGRFEVALDAQPGDAIPVRVARPGTTALLLKIRVEP